MILPISLNTSTLREHGLDLVAEIEVAAAAGFQGIDPWMDEIERYEGSGGSMGDLRKRLADRGLRVPCAIDFCEWLVDDPARRKAGLEAARRSMEKLARIGAECVAAAPWHVEAPVDPTAAGERYRTLLELGELSGVVPLLEFWGKSPALWRLAQAIEVVVECAHPKAAILADVYHLYKGGSGVDGLLHVRGESIGCFHFNDYPASPPRNRIEDADRVYPGDGVAPLSRIVSHLRRIGFGGALSVELFNPSYYRRPAAEVARAAFEKTRRVIEASP